jgi:hypothetical protein
MVLNMAWTYLERTIRFGKSCFRTEERKLRTANGMSW